MSNMRAKMRVSNVVPSKNIDGETTGERVEFNAVAKTGGYGADGLDENNNFAKWTPNANASFSILNPNLFGKFELGQEYYVDFVKVE